MSLYSFHALNHCVWVQLLKCFTSTFLINSLHFFLKDVTLLNDVQSTPDFRRHRRAAARAAPAATALRPGPRQEQGRGEEVLMRMLQKN